MPLKNFILLSVLFICYSLVGQAAPCEVPVCDIPAELEMLRAGNQNFRFKRVELLKKDLEKIRDPEVLSGMHATLENLHEFGKAATQLFLELQEEDWVIQEGRNLSTLAVTLLLRYDRPVHGESLVAWYRELGSENARFDILAFWLNESKKSTSLVDLAEIIYFAGKAREISIELHDSDWVAQKAESLAVAATALSVGLNPYHEGVYRVTLSCSTQAADEGYACDPAKIRTINQITVLNGMSNGIVVDFSNALDQIVGYHFYSVVFETGTASLRGTSTVDPTARHFFQIEIDPKTNVLTGSVTDTQTMSRYNIVGRARVNAGSLLKTVPPKSLTVQDIVGVYQGNIGTLRGRLMVKMLDEKTLAASFVDSKNNLYPLNPLTIDFQEANWQQKIGFLSLITSLHRGGTAKLLLAYRSEDSAGRIVLEGFHFGGTIGTPSLAKFVKQKPKPKKQ